MPGIPVDVTKVAEVDLPCGVRGIVMRLEAGPSYGFIRDVLVRSLGAEMADMSPEPEWHSAYAVVPFELAERLGWSCELGESTPCLAGLPVHGGCTYAKVGELREADVPEDALVIGWDYHHGEDRFADYTLEKVCAELREFGEYIRQLAEAE